MNEKGPFRWYEPFIVGARQAAFIFVHSALAGLFIALGFGLHHLLLYLGDPKLFDAVPWRYVVDLMDLTLVGTFIIMGVLEAVRIFRGER